jgi:hypothetical protein
LARFCHQTAFAALPFLLTKEEQMPPHEALDLGSDREAGRRSRSATVSQGV